MAGIGFNIKLWKLQQNCISGISMSCKVLFSIYQVFIFNRIPSKLFLMTMMECLLLQSENLGGKHT